MSEKIEKIKEQFEKICIEENIYWVDEKEEWAAMNNIDFSDKIIALITTLTQEAREEGRNEAMKYIEKESLISFGDGQDFSPERFKKICDKARHPKEK